MLLVWKANLGGTVYFYFATVDFENSLPLAHTHIVSRPVPETGLA